MLEKEQLIDENHPIAKECFPLYSGVITYQIRQDLLKIINKAIHEYNKAREE